MNEPVKECTTLAIFRLTGKMLEDKERTALNAVIEIEKYLGKADLSLTKDWRGKTVSEFQAALKDGRITGVIGAINVAATDEHCVGHIMPFLAKRIENVIGYHNEPISFVASWEAGC